eukprot:6268093-Pyramimonas_sp.AAC.1
MIVSAGVVGPVGLDAFLVENLPAYARMFCLLQETRMLPAASESMEAWMRGTGYSDSDCAALPAAGDPTRGLITATPKIIGNRYQPDLSI